jgi:hypothetical protein
MPTSGSVPVRREDRDLSQFLHFQYKGKQTGREHAVVIGYQDVFCHFCLLSSKNLRRFSRVSIAKTTIKLKIMNVSAIIFCLFSFMDASLLFWLEH